MPLHSWYADLLLNGVNKITLRPLALSAARHMPPMRPTTDKSISLDIKKFPAPMFYWKRYRRVVVYDGPEADGHVIYKTTSSRRKVVKSSSNVMTVEFFAGYGRTTGSFEAYFKAKDDLCPHTYLNATSSSQLLKFSGSNDTTDLPMQCVWTVDSGADNSRMIIEFSSVSMVASCDSEFLEVKDRPYDQYSQTTKICGSESSDPFYSRGRKIKVVYNQFEASNVSSFALQYRIADCSRNYTGSAGSITNLGFPDSFSINDDCTLRVTSPEGTFLAFYFVQFDLGSNKQCLQIIDASSNQVGKSCGKIIPSPVFVSSNTATVKIQTDAAASVRYDILYVGSDTKPGCGGNLTDVYHGILTNPEYPDVPDETLDCVWKLSVTSGRLEVSLDSVLMPEKPIHDCSVSYLQVDSKKFCTGSHVKFSYSHKDITVRYVSTSGSPAVKFSLKLTKLNH
ncbi:cubilin [Elysia marginata]|uniref:Cubilin n=1 Tax=Elysia marginata TaxID=1093978 RepID=A0AAV4FH87_9GAST|nr:cubilin [Elysia marginata]